MLQVPPVELLSALSAVDPSILEELRRQLSDGDFSGEVRDLPGRPDELALELLPLAKAFSLAPVSGFSVGAVAVAASGRLYLGANLEFAGAPLGTTLHAEQSAVVNAWIHGEQELREIVVSELPCGHCRQFLCELTGAPQLRITTGGRTTPLAELLPAAFGEALKARPGGLLDGRPVDLESVREIETSLGQRALNAAQKSHTPYTRGAEGFVIEGDNGHFYVGRAAESAAFNPSIPAVVCALNQRNLSSGRSYTICACAHARVVTALSCNQKLSADLMARISGAPIETVLLEES